uniref:Uncharacterized protein n=1 Tax=Setaria italica TaxID=4555 RepID=K3YBL3_SETIT
MSGNRTDTRIGNNYCCKFVPYRKKKEIQEYEKESIILAKYHYSTKYMLPAFNVIH